MGKTKQRSGKAKKADMRMERSNFRVNNVHDVSGQEQVDEAAHNFRLKGGEGSQAAGSLLTIFHNREAKFEIDRRVEASSKPFVRQNHHRTENMYQELMDLPRRPKWNPKQKNKKIVENEDAAFEKYLADAYAKYPPHRLNHFEHNVLVWKELWRCLEMSDVLLLSTDARHPLFHFPPTLYSWVVGELKKPMVLVLNKVDLIPHSTLTAWMEYFKQHFPGLRLFPFTSYPDSVSDTLDVSKKRPNLKLHQGELHKGRLRQVDNLLSICLELLSSSATSVSTSVPSTSSFTSTTAASVSSTTSPATTSSTTSSTTALSTTTSSTSTLSTTAPSTVPTPASTASSTVSTTPTSTSTTTTPSASTTIQSISEDDADEEDEVLFRLARLRQDHVEREESEEEGHAGDKAEERAEEKEEAKEEAEHEAAEAAVVEETKGRLMIGVIGQPNTGKSSLMNALLGRAAVGVSQTPGKTKHLQTVQLQQNIVLCDCPGLVFPALDMPKALQALSGVLPLPQLREPFSAVQYLAERIPLETIYGLSPPVAVTTKKKVASEFEDDMFAGLTAEDEHKAGAPFPWSAVTICEALARKRNYILAGGGRLDIHKAALEILYDVVSGQTVLYFDPPDEPAAPETNKL